MTSPDPAAAGRLLLRAFGGSVRRRASLHCRCHCCAARRGPRGSRHAAPGAGPATGPWPSGELGARCICWRKRVIRQFGGRLHGGEEGRNLVRALRLRGGVFRNLLRLCRRLGLGLLLGRLGGLGRVCGGSGAASAPPAGGSGAACLRLRLGLGAGGCSACVGGSSGWAAGVSAAACWRRSISALSCGDLLIKFAVTALAAGPPPAGSAWRASAAAAAALVIGARSRPLARNLRICSTSAEASPVSACASKCRLADPGSGLGSAGGEQRQGHQARVQGVQVSSDSSSHVPEA